MLVRVQADEIPDDIKEHEVNHLVEVGHSASHIHPDG
jgi:hypothetical protein